MTQHLLVSERLSGVERPDDFEERVLTDCGEALSKTMKWRDKEDSETIVTFRLADESTQDSEESVVKVKETEVDGIVQLEVHRYLADSVDTSRKLSIVQEDYQRVREVLEDV